ncbi:NCAIR mutase (PurE)-related protein [Lentzea atacamensis]|uniref:NCAIR mutase (PurE)-related protein n=2 Tax=Lentzea TaxID=165301 RepID=A0A316HW44_9PSEU|nr:nickel pincer cofactor biosynthesis protein LarB [Lentzea atacamensis]PWK85652.1 NCAIR mutase (PurE)-related protein [Lentzea atacamensis]
MTRSDAVDLGFARVDVGREARQGLPEVIYGTGKTASEIASIARTLLRHNAGPVLATRVDAETAAVVLAVVQGGSAAGSRVGDASAAVLTAVGDGCAVEARVDALHESCSGAAAASQPDAAATALPPGIYDAPARLLVWRPAAPIGFSVVVAAAGTADQPVAREAAAIAAAVGLTVTTVTDVGVAGLHRLLAEQERLRAADTVIVVAGMEGALASAIGGLVECPVVAVPTSTGYGAGLEGITALLAMHASCAAGITVVNIDSGFGAAMAAFRLSRVARRRVS